MIPRIVHAIWLGGPLPDWASRFLDTWRRPGWRVLLWDDITVRCMFPLKNQDVYNRAEEIAPDHVGQLRSDVLRYEILDRLGGVYVDVDLECLKPIDELFEPFVDHPLGPHAFAAWEAQSRWIGNTFLAAEADSPFFRDVIRDLPVSVEDRPGERPARMTGPQFITRVWEREGGLTDVFPERFFFPYSWDEVDERGPGEGWPREAYAVHHWANQRRERGLPSL